MSDLEQGKELYQLYHTQLIATWHWTFTMTNTMSSSVICNKNVCTQEYVRLVPRLYPQG